MKHAGKRILTIGIALVCALAVCIGIGAVYTRNRPIWQLEHALGEGEFKTVQTLYEENNSDSDFKECADSILSDFINNTYEKYLSQEESYDSTLDALQGIKFYGEDATSCIKKVGEIDKSRSTYLAAEEAFQSENYQESLKLYRRVIEEDIDNYSKAQEQIGNCIEKWRIQAKNNISKLLSEGKNAEAIREIKMLPKDILDNGLSEMKTMAVTKLTAEAETYSEAGDYCQAVNILTNDDGIVIDTAFSKAVKDFRIKELQSLKPSVEVEYDSIDKEYSIQSCALKRKSTSINNLSQINASVSSAPYMFFLAFILVDKNLIFTDTVLVDCDGKQFAFPVDRLDLHTSMLSNGYIIEIASFGHSELFSSGTARNLRPVVEAMHSAEKVTVRFKGSRGYKDITVPSSHVQGVYALWRIYEILGKDVSLISYLK